MFNATFTHWELSSCSRFAARAILFGWVALSGMARWPPRAAFAAVVALACLVCVALGHGEQVDFNFEWHPHETYTYRVDTKWWLSTGAGRAIDASQTEDHGWSPPVGPDNHGMRCTLSIHPEVREQWPAGPPDDHREPNAWLLRFSVRFCVPLRSRFHGSYNALPRPAEVDLDDDPAARRLRTPFYVIRTDDGLVRRLLFFGNETVSSRNFKRGMTAFLSFVDPMQASVGTVRDTAGRVLREARVRSYSSIDQDENGIYMADYTLLPGTQAPSLQLRRSVSHKTLLASAGDRANEARARRGEPTPRALHFRTTTATLSPGHALEASVLGRRAASAEEASLASSHHLAKVVTRAVHATDASNAAPTSSGNTQRAATAAERERGPPEHDEAHVVLKDPPVQYVESVAQLWSITRDPEAAETRPIPSVVGRAADGSGRRLHALTRLEDAVGSTVPDEMDDEAHRMLKAAARHYLDATATVTDAGVPRRLLSVEDAADDLVLFDVSPTAHVTKRGVHDIPPEHDRVDTFTEAGLDENGEPLSVPSDIVDEYLQCAEAVRGGEEGGHKVARCLLDMMGHVDRNPEVLSVVLDMLDPNTLEELQEHFAHATQALLAVASANGNDASQAAMCKLLLSIEHETPEVKSYVEAHDFLFVVDAITEVVEPTDATIDCLHESLQQHEDHQDQYHQVLLGLGSLGRSYTDDHPQHRRILRTLEARFDAAVEANQAVEAEFARHLQSAQEQIARMPAEEWHMWMCRANHVDRREWAETWERASPAQRAEYEDHTTDVIAHIIAGNNGGDDGYGIRHDYSRPARRLRPTPARGFSWDTRTEEEIAEQEGGITMLPADEGHNAALIDVLTVQATDLRYAVQALANLGHHSSAPRVLSLTSHRKLAVRAFAVHALHALPCPASRRVLLSVLEDPMEDPMLRASAADALGEWPEEHLYADDHVVLRAALRHLATNDGVDWGDCETECAALCTTRSIAHCDRACSRECKSAAYLETAVVSLLQHRWRLSTEDMVSDEEVHDAARRLAARASETLPPQAAYDEHHDLHQRGARRLFKLLEVLEEIFRYTKFDFRAGFQQDWKLSVGKKSVVGAFAGAGLKNIMEINVGIFAGFFAIDIDNWATARVYMLGFALDFFDAKAAFIAGMSYVNKAAGQLLANAQSALGNVANALRELPGRAIGYIMEFRKRLTSVSDKVNHYLTKGEEFVAMASSYGDVGNVVQALALHGLQKLEAYVTSLIAKYDVVSVAKQLATDAYERSVGLLTAPDSPLTTVLNFLDDLDAFLTKVVAFRDTLQDTFNMITGRILRFPHQVRQAVAVAMKPINKVVEGLEELEKARVAMGEQIQTTIDMAEDMLDFEPQVHDLVEQHVSNYTAMLAPVQEQIIEVRTVVETIHAVSSAAGLGIDSMRTTLLSYMRSLVPDAKAVILAEGEKSVGALRSTAIERLGSVLGTFNASAAGESGETLANSALSQVPALLETVQSVGAGAASFLDGAGGGSPLQKALDVVREGVAGSATGVLGDLNSVVADFVAGFNEDASPVGIAQGSVKDRVMEVLASLAEDVMPAALDAVSSRLAASMDGSVGDVVAEITRVFLAIREAWERVIPQFKDLMMPRVDASEVEPGSGWGLDKGALELGDDGSMKSLWTAALAEASAQLQRLTPDFAGGISAAALNAVKDMFRGLPQLDKGAFGVALQSALRDAVEATVRRVAADAKVAGVDALEAVWADVVAVVQGIGTPALVTDVVSTVNQIAEDLADEIGSTGLRSVLTAF